MPPATNLRRLMEIVQDQLSHRPDTAEWRRKLVEKLDAVNRRFCGDPEYDWPWMRRIATLPMYPDIDMPLGVGGMTRKIGWGARTFDIPLSRLDGVMYPESEASLWLEHHQAFEQGGEVLLADRSLDPVPGLTEYGNWAYAPFAIEYAIPTSGIAPSPANVTIQLDPRAYVPALSGAEGNVRIRWPRRLLPADCASVIAVRDASGRRLRPMDQAQLSLSEADRDRIGEPVYMLEDYGVDLRALPRAHPSSAMAATPHHTHSPYSWERENWSVEETPSIALFTDGGSTVKTNTAHYVIVSWYYAGKYGPPSRPLYIKTTTTNGIRLSNLKMPPASGAQFEYGRRLSVWMREGELGPYVLKGFVTDPSAVTYDIITNNGAPSDQRLRMPRWDEHYYDDMPKYIRIYPRPGSFQRYEVEYRAHPRALLSDVDVPEIDGPQSIIAYLAASELAASMGGDPGPSLSLAAQDLRKLLARAGLADRTERRLGQVGVPSSMDGFDPRYFISANRNPWGE